MGKVCSRRGWLQGLLVGLGGLLGLSQLRGGPAPGGAPRQKGSPVWVMCYNAQSEPVWTCLYDDSGRLHSVEYYEAAMTGPYEPPPRLESMLPRKTGTASAQDAPSLSEWAPGSVRSYSYDLPQAPTA
jgi:hypothetical protein